MGVQTMVMWFAVTGSAVAVPPSAVSIDPAPMNVQLPLNCTSPFCDEAAAAGLHVLGPAHGRGAAAVDVDGDGWEDIWQSNDRLPALGNAMYSTLWHNEGDGTFTPMDLGIDPYHLDSNWSAAWADYDNDGDKDVYLVAGGYGGTGPSHLYRNDLNTTGTFTDVNAIAGLNSEVHSWWGATWADFDRDGWLDVAIQGRNEPNGGNIGGPSAAPTILYHNNGDGTFTDVTAAMGISIGQGDHKNPVWLDINYDGWQDLYLGSLHDARLFVNNGGNGFVEMRSARASTPVFAAAAADFNQDGVDDLYIGRQNGQEIIVLGSASQITVWDQRQGLITGARENTMGLTVGDLTTNGWPDAMLGTGTQAEAREPVVMCMLPFRYRFGRCTDRGLFGVPSESRHHGGAIADFDHDGDNDFFYNLGGSTLFDFANPGIDSRELSALHLRNFPLAGNTATVHLVGTVSNRDAIGARMEVTGTEEHHYVVRNSQGFQSQNSEWITVYLGTATQAQVSIRWPSGVLTNTTVGAGTRIEITE